MSMYTDLIYILRHFEDIDRSTLGQCNNGSSDSISNNNEMTVHGLAPKIPRNNSTLSHAMDLAIRFMIFSEWDPVTTCDLQASEIV